MSDMESNQAVEATEENQSAEAAGESTNENFDLDSLRTILEGVLLAAGRPLNLDQLQTLLGGESGPDRGTLRRALSALEADCANRGVELVEVASGFRLQVRQELQPWVTKLWEERPPRYSRALLETLALIAYRQPITRGEIEDVRGVSVSTNIIRQLEEREWIRVVGHRDVPGKPALFGTTKAFLDYFGLKNLDDLPSLAELRDIESLEPELDFSGKSEAAGQSTEAGAEPAGDEAEAAALEAEAAEGGAESQEAAEAGDDTGAPENAEVSEATESPEAPEAQDTAEAPGAEDQPGTPDDPGAGEAPEAPDEPEASGASGEDTEDVPASGDAPEEADDAESDAESADDDSTADDETASGWRH